MTARRLLWLLPVLIAGLLAVPATAEEVPTGYSYEDAWFDSTDGTQLHAGVFLPSDRQPGERLPVLLVSTPYTAPNGGATSAGNLEGPVVRFPELFDHPAFRAGRWAYVQVDVRGFGGSEGCFEYYLPSEAEDVRVAVEWAASQEWSTGRVGMWGKSYDAAQQVLALASKPEGLAATVIQAPGLSAYTALWMNGVHYATGRYGTTGVYTADDVGPPQNPETATSPEYGTAAAAPVTSIPGNPTCRTDALAGMNAIGDRDDPFWEGKEPYRGAAGSDVPTFWQQGFFDANTKPVYLDIWSSLTGPKQGWFAQTPHIRGHEAGMGREGFNDEAFRFLDRYVRGVEPAQTDPAVTVQSGGPDGEWRAEAQWPPADATPWTVPVRAGSFDDAPDAVVGGPARAGHWTVTPALPYPVHVAGEVVLDATVSSVVPGTHVVARLYDVAPDGLARLVTRGAMATEAAGEQKARFALYPQDWVLAPGHRLAVHLSGGDDNWFSPGVTGTTVDVLGGELTVPVLTLQRDTYLEGDVSESSASTTVTVPAATLDEATVDVAPPAEQVPAGE